MRRYHRHRLILPPAVEIKSFAIPVTPAGELLSASHSGLLWEQLLQAHEIERVKGWRIVPGDDWEDQLKVVLQSPEIRIPARRGLGRDFYADMTLRQASVLSNSELMQRDNVIPQSRLPWLHRPLRYGIAGPLLALALPVILSALGWTYLSEVPQSAVPEQGIPASFAREQLASEISSVKAELSDLQWRSEQLSLKTAQAQQQGQAVARLQTFLAHANRLALIDELRYEEGAFWVTGRAQGDGGVERLQDLLQTTGNHIRLVSLAKLPAEEGLVSTQFSLLVSPAGPVGDAS